MDEYGYIPTIKHSQKPSLLGLAQQHSFLQMRLTRKLLLQICAAVMTLALIAMVLMLSHQEGHKWHVRRQLQSVHETKAEPESQQAPELARFVCSRGRGCHLVGKPQPEPGVQQSPGWAKWNVWEPPEGAGLDSFESILTVNSTNWEAVAEAIANAKGQIMFTTLYGADEDQVQMTANFYSWLHASQLSNNMLLLSESIDTCRLLWRFGLPCWYDGLCPRGEQLPSGQYRDTWHMAWYCKYWWALKLVQAGYDVAFLDNDNVVISNPWQKVDAQKYDVEGLSDFVKHNKIPSPLELLARPQDCLYKHNRRVGELSGPESQQTAFDGQDFDKGSAWVMAPCMSSGLWFAHPTRAAALFLDSVIKYLWMQPDEWEQAALQEVLVAHLLNLDDQHPRLRFRLLPHADYANLGPYQHALENRHTQEAVIAHPCCVGINKPSALSKAHLWQSDSWQPEWGHQIMQGFQECLTSPLAAACKRIKNVVAPAQGTSQHHFHRHHSKWLLKHVAVPV